MICSGEVLKSYSVCVVNLGLQIKFCIYAKTSTINESMNKFKKKEIASNKTRLVTTDGAASSDAAVPQSGTCLHPPDCQCWLPQSQGSHAPPP